MRGAPLHELFPDLAVLRGDPRYDALAARMAEHVETERAAAGLEAVET